MSEQNTGLIAFDQLPSIASGANAVYASNKKKLDSGVARGNSLLDTIEAEGMTDELDAEVNKYLGLVATAVDQMNTARKPFTQLVTALCKEFTGMENQFDKAKPDTVPGRLQEARNNYARHKEAAARAKEEELRKQRIVEEEKINIKAGVETSVREKYGAILFTFKKKYNDLFNTITIENIKQVEKELLTIPVLYPRDKFLEIAVPITSNYISVGDLAPIIFDAKSDLYEDCSDDFTKEMDALKHYLLEQIPARKFELEEITKAKGKEQKALADAAKLRQQEEELRLERERQQKEKEASELIATNASIQQAELSFNHDVAAAELRTDQASVKHSYVIEVKTVAGWNQISTFWFQHFGSKMPLDKFPKKTFDSMRSDLEKLALSSNGQTRIADSGHLQYLSDVKAVTKR